MNKNDPYFEIKGKKVNRITNTAQQMQDNPSLALAMALGGIAESIENQERAGTKQAAASSVLPTEDLQDYAEGGPYAYMGIKVLNPVPNDALFTYVELPEGWKVVPTDHSMHNSIVDDKGRKRAGYFYKAACYDRIANMYPPLARFKLDYGNNDDYGPEGGLREIVIVDNAKYKIDSMERIDPDCIIQTFSQAGAPGELGYKIADELKAKAREWLDKHYPDWKKPEAYWD